MKREPVQNTFIKRSHFLLFVTLTIFSCKKPNTETTLPDYQLVNLVSDVPTYQPETVDPGLVNPWGMAVGPTGAFWLSDNHSGLTTVYDRQGNTLKQAVAVPYHDRRNGGSPTGVVFNKTDDFFAPGPGGVPKKALFIYATEGGTVSVWNGADSTFTVADRSASNAVYKGVTIANNGGNNFIYLADFKNAKIDVLDKNYNYVNMNFSDPLIPQGFAPFNIKEIGGKLYVNYAKQQGPDNEDDESGPGNGFVDIYNTNGSLEKRFASQGALNSPWGVTAVPESFGLPIGSILIGNFGDGRINVFDANGKYLGQLKKGSTPIAIEGLWEIMFEDAAIQGSDPNVLFFSAGPGGEAHGLFGYLMKQQ